MMKKVQKKWELRLGCVNNDEALRGGVEDCSKIVRSSGVAHGWHELLIIERSVEDDLRSLMDIPTFHQIHLEDLRVLVEQEENFAAASAFPRALSEDNTFWGLKKLEISKCCKMKKLLTHILLPLLTNLEELSI
ncbi:hypothetical protein ACJRO7_025185 [Eucalyptus globulus]|uniref:Uncharacterized protein n=1 Tax=Eucalyptus globulus TaxID=34317 RepID=A0ABD3K836_EUCGL